MLHIPEDLIDKIREHGETHFPEEGAGFILGSVSDDHRYAEYLLPMTNQFEAEARSRRYLIEPEEMIQSEMKAEDLGLEIIGVFHSHPNHPAVPSEFDRERALPWYSYIITSIYQDGAQECRSWRLTDERQFSEEEIIILSKGTEF
jgi:proteasome lid subunit RPN8/RPN11